MLLLFRNDQQFLKYSINFDDEGHILLVTSSFMQVACLLQFVASHHLHHDMSVQFGVLFYSILNIPQHKMIHLRVRTYSSRKGAIYNTVQTQIVPKRRGPGGVGANMPRRYPWVETVFRDRDIQPVIHEAHVRFIQQGRQYDYLIFCQNHLHLPLNSSLQDRWRGDIVVIRVAQNPDIGIVNARAEDTLLIDEMIHE